MSCRLDLNLFILEAIEQPPVFLTSLEKSFMFTSKLFASLSFDFRNFLTRIPLNLSEAVTKTLMTFLKHAYNSFFITFILLFIRKQKQKKPVVVYHWFLLSFNCNFTSSFHHASPSIGLHKFALLQISFAATTTKVFNIQLHPTLVGSLSPAYLELEFYTFLQTLKIVGAVANVFTI